MESRQDNNRMQNAKEEIRKAKNFDMQNLNDRAELKIWCYLQNSDHGLLKDMESKERLKASYYIRKT